MMSTVVGEGSRCCTRPWAEVTWRWKVEGEEGGRLLELKGKICGTKGAEAPTFPLWDSRLAPTSVQETL
jgi:hypothetical protein